MIYLQFGHALRCPAAKFITHTCSHLCFLFLLAAATFRLDEGAYPISTPLDDRVHDNLTAEEVKYMFKQHGMEPEPEVLLKQTFRPANELMTDVQICLWFWILGTQNASKTHQKIHPI